MKSAAPPTRAGPFQPAGETPVDWGWGPHRKCRGDGDARIDPTTLACPGVGGDLSCLPRTRVLHTKREGQHHHQAPPPFFGVAAGPRLPGRAWAGPARPFSGESASSELGPGRE